MTERTNGHPKPDQLEKTGRQEIATGREIINGWSRSVQNPEGEERFFNEAPGYLFGKVLVSGLFDEFGIKISQAGDRAAMEKAFGALPRASEEEAMRFIAFFTGEEPPERTPDVLGSTEFEDRSSAHIKRKGKKVTIEAYERLEREIRDGASRLVSEVGEDNFFSGSKLLMERWRQECARNGVRISEEDSNARILTTLDRQGNKRHLETYRWEEVMRHRVHGIGSEVFHMALDVVNHTEAKKRTIKLPKDFESTGGILRVNGVDLELPVKHNLGLSFQQILSYTMLLDAVDIDPKVREKLLTQMLPRCEVVDKGLAFYNPTGEEMFAFNPEQQAKQSDKKSGDLGIDDKDFVIALLAARRSDIPLKLKSQYEDFVLRFEPSRHPDEDTTVILPSGTKFKKGEFGRDRRSAMLEKRPMDSNWGYIMDRELGLFAIREAHLHRENKGNRYHAPVLAGDYKDGYLFRLSHPELLETTLTVNTRTMDIDQGFTNGRYSSVDRTIYYLLIGMEDASPTEFGERRKANITNALLNSLDIQVLPKADKETTKV